MNLNQLNTVDGFRMAGFVLDVREVQPPNAHTPTILTGTMTGPSGQHFSITIDAKGEAILHAVAWWTLHHHRAALWAWLDERGETPHDGPAHFMEKPWKWDAEWETYQQELAQNDD